MNPVTTLFSLPSATPTPASVPQPDDAAATFPEALAGIGFRFAASTPVPPAAGRVTDPERAASPESSVTNATESDAAGAAHLPARQETIITIEFRAATALQSGLSLEQVAGGVAEVVKGLERARSNPAATTARREHAVSMPVMLPNAETRSASVVADRHDSASAPSPHADPNPSMRVVHESRAASDPLAVSVVFDDAIDPSGAARPLEATESEPVDASSAAAAMRGGEEPARPSYNRGRPAVDSRIVPATPPATRPPAREPDPVDVDTKRPPDPAGQVASARVPQDGVALPNGVSTDPTISERGGRAETGGFGPGRTGGSDAASSENRTASTDLAPGSRRADASLTPHTAPRPRPAPSVPRRSTASAHTIRPSRLPIAARTSAPTRDPSVSQPQQVPVSGGRVEATPDAHGGLPALEIRVERTGPRGASGNSDDSVDSEPMQPVGRRAIASVIGRTRGRHPGAPDIVSSATVVRAPRRAPADTTRVEGRDGVQSPTIRRASASAGRAPITSRDMQHDVTMRPRHEEPADLLREIPGPGLVDRAADRPSSGTPRGANRVGGESLFLPVTVHGSEPDDVEVSRIPIDRAAPPPRARRAAVAIELPPPSRSAVTAGMAAPTVDPPPSSVQPPPAEVSFTPLPQSLPASQAPRTDWVVLRVDGQDDAGVRIRVAVRGDLVRATIVHDDPGVADHIRHHLDDLGRALARRGFVESRLEVQRSLVHSTLAAAQGHGGEPGRDGAAPDGRDDRGWDHQREREQGDGPPRRRDPDRRSPKDRER